MASSTFTDKSNREGDSKLKLTLEEHMELMRSINWRKCYLEALTKQTIQNIKARKKATTSHQED